METPETTPRHPIRVVAQRTGLTPATIRAWERRYAAVRPSRSEGGQRLYTDRDVERLATLRRLTEVGRPISMVAGLSDEDARALLLEDRQAAPGSESMNGAEPKAVVARSFDRILSLDGDGLERALWRAAMTLDGKTFLDDVVSPLLTRVGEGWAAGTLDPGQEHLGSDVIDRVLSRMADSSRSNGGPGLVVATLPGERHGLGARLVSTAATVDGWSVTYLGTDLPVADIAAAARGVGAVAVAISVVAADDLGAAADALRELRGLLDASVLLIVGGAAAGRIDAARLPGKVFVADGLDAIRSLHPHVP